MATADELLAEIYRHPDELRRVVEYADALRPIGDPRAELIDLQVRRACGQGDLGDVARCRSLVRQHWRAWVGDPAAIFVGKEPPDFSCGMLARAHLRIATDADRALARDPVFSTLESLTCEQAEHVIHAGMRRLRFIAGLTLRTLAALCAMPFALPITQATVDANGWTSEIGETLARADGPLYAQLSTLFIERIDDPAHVEWLLTSPLVARLETLGVSGWRRPLPMLMRLYTEHPGLSTVLGGGWTLKRWVRPVVRPVLELSVTDESSLDVLDGIDGAGFLLVLQLASELSTDPEERSDQLAAYRARCVGFDDVQIAERPSDDYEGGL